MLLTDLLCAICKHTLNRAVEAPCCQHLFRTECVFEWLCISSACPTCQQGLFRSLLKPMHLRSLEFCPKSQSPAITLSSDSTWGVEIWSLLTNLEIMSPMSGFFTQVQHPCASKDCSYTCYISQRCVDITTIKNTGRCGKTSISTPGCSPGRRWQARDNNQLETPNLGEGV